MPPIVLALVNTLGISIIPFTIPDIVHTSLFFRARLTIHPQIIRPARFRTAIVGAICPVGNRRCTVSLR